MQRCWAHVIREARHLSEANPDSEAAGDVLVRLRRIFDDAKGRRPAGERRAARDLLVLRIRRIMSRYGSDPLLKQFMAKLGRALPDLFTFVLDPRVPPTNNAAERGLREVVVHRKIRGALRSEKTADQMGNIFTCFATWKSAGLDRYLAEMAKYV